MPCRLNNFFTFAPMKSPILSKLSPFPLLISVIIVTLISFFLFTILGIVSVVLAYGIPIQEVLNQFSPAGGQNIGVLKVLQISQSVGIFIVPALTIGWLASENTFGYLGFQKNFDWTGFGLMILVLLASEPIVAYSGILNEGMNLPDFLAGVESWMAEMEEKAMELTETFLNVTTLGGLSVNLLMIALIPGIGEELFFRGLLQPLFHKWFKNTHVAVIFTAVLFSALHMQFYGFLPRMLLGIVFGYLFVWTKNMWYPILAHAIHNSIPVIGYYLYASDKSSIDVDEVGTGSNTWIWALVGLVLLIIFAKRLREQFLDK